MCLPRVTLILEENITYTYRMLCTCRKLVKEIEAIFNRSGLTAIIEIKESNIMLGLNSSEDVDVIINIIIFISM
jgi:hypothetical protein